jgi:hypothetical protein
MSVRCLSWAAVLLFLIPGRLVAEPPAHRWLAKGLSEAQFHQVLDVVESTYARILASRGVRFVIERRWNDDASNATPFSGASFMGLSMSGGLARVRGMTQDALALVACHELGHLLGGYPNNEGQADYFATAKCLREIFTQPAARVFSKVEAIDATAEKACRQAFRQTSERDICIRSAMAALSASVATTGWSDDEPAPSLATPDAFQTTVTDGRHANRQCRLDTQFQGALCSKRSSEQFSDTDPVPGACTEAEHFSLGLRPRCWYLPPERPHEAP